MKWIKIDGNEIKPIGSDIIIRHFVAGDKNGTYHKGWYDDEFTNTYKMCDEPPIEQSRITHYFILEEPK